jgi:phosphate transport system substrate-binding protein
MKNIPGSTIILTALIAGGLSSWGQSITVRSSDTVLKLSQDWAAGYLAQHSDVKIEVSGGSVTNAFAALAEKKARLTTVPRSIRFREAQACEAALGQRPTEFKLAVNAVAIYVNASNPVKYLTYDELEAIFQGKRRNWQKLGGNNSPVMAFGVETSTPVGELFVEEVLAGKGFTNDVKIVSAPELLKVIAQEPNGVGFGPLVPADGVRVVQIKRAFSSTPVAPGEETISNRTYPISRFVFGYVDPAVIQDDLKAYLDWIRGEEGQQIARQGGYFPLAAKWRTTP